MLLIFFGNIGTGKSCVAEKVAGKLGYDFVNFDKVMWLVVRKNKMYGDMCKFFQLEIENSSPQSYLNSDPDSD